MALLALGLGYQDKLEESVELNCEVLKVREEMLGKEDRQTLNSLYYSILANSYQTEKVHGIRDDAATSIL